MCVSPLFSPMPSLLTHMSIALNGFAHVEFASTEEALRAARQGAQQGFRYGQRLLDVDFAPWVFYIGPAYRVVYISGWPASSSRPALSQWAYDIPNLIATTVCTSFCSLHLPNTTLLTHTTTTHYSATIPRRGPLKPPRRDPTFPIHRLRARGAPKAGWPRRTRRRDAVPGAVAPPGRAHESAVAVGVCGGRRRGGVC